ncbi:MAG TPA: universal stress protein [Mycobacteriales bacterium]|nr:universal stress protein [Mycobacteriales bacterium]
MSGVVVVGVHGSLTSLAALRTAVDEARSRRAELVPVLAWAPAGGELVYRAAPSAPLLNFWRAQARERLMTAFEEALGGIPKDIAVTPHAVRSHAGQILVRAAESPEDLLVVGYGHRRVFGRRLIGATARYCVSHATGRVVLVPPPELLHTRHRFPGRTVSAIRAA